MRQYSIYYLLDPITLDVRYVGCSCRPFERFRKSHLKDKTESHKARWIRKLLRNDLRPILMIKCIVQTVEEAYRMECALIAKLRSNGEALTNATQGGEGVQGLSQESLLKKSIAGKIRYENPLEREQASLYAKLGWMNPEFRTQQAISRAKSWDNLERHAHLSARMRETWENPETRAKRIASLQKPWSEQRRAAMTGVYQKSENWVAGFTGKQHTEEAKEAIRQAKIGKKLQPWSDERRAKVAATWAAKKQMQ